VLWCKGERKGGGRKGGKEEGRKATDRDFLFELLDRSSYVGCFQPSSLFLLDFPNRSEGMPLMLLQAVYPIVVEHLICCVYNIGLKVFVGGEAEASSSLTTCCHNLN